MLQYIIIVKLIKGNMLIIIMYINLLNDDKNLAFILLLFLSTIYFRLPSLAMLSRVEWPACAISCGSQVTPSLLSSSTAHCLSYRYIVITIH